MMAGMGCSRRSPVPFIVLLTGLALATASGPLSGQASRRVVVTLSADTVEMGSVFELLVQAPVPTGAILRFPDSLPATATMESAAPARSTSAESADGTIVWTLVYPMMPFGTGDVTIPGFDLTLLSADGRGERSRNVVRVPERTVWVAPVLTVEDLARPIEPEGPKDVVGGDWSRPALTLMLVCSSVLALALVSMTQGWLARAADESGPALPTLEARRARALREMDELLADGLHATGQQREFYTRTTSIVRRYAHSVDGRFAPSLTSSELVVSLGASYPQATGTLPEEMCAAEAVKFGRRCPDADSAERHWNVLRRWISTSPHAPS